MSCGATPGGDIHGLQFDDEEEIRRLKRMRRFGQDGGETTTAPSSTNDDTEERLLMALSTSRKKGERKVDLGGSKKTKGTKSDRSGEPLVGKSTALEKSYLRLTTDPKAEDVRPLHILRKALAHIKHEFIQNEDFDWANDQLKAVRQDLTVQHLRNDFVLQVYETHARILLEHGDLNEFNQCQTMIRSLTDPNEPNRSESEGQEGSLRQRKNHAVPCYLRQMEEKEDEFQGYSLLYSLVQNSPSDMIMTLSRFHKRTNHKNSGIPAVARGSSIRHALKVVKAVMHNDYQTFFRLYESAPHLSSYLMDFLVRRVRKAAYERIVASYRPTVGLERVREILAFADMEETRRFLKKSGVVWVKEHGGPPSWVDCKASWLALNER